MEIDYLGIFVTFAVVHLLAAISPGPNLVIVSRYASTRSRQAGLLAMLGIILGTLTWSSAAALGLGVVLTNFPLIYTAIQYVGVVYLIWLGIRMLKDGIANQYQDAEISSADETSVARIILSAYLVNLTNPKTIAYYTSLFAVLIPMDSPSWVFAVTVLVAVSVSASWWALVATVFSTQTVGRFLSSIRRYIDLVTGGAMILLGLRLAMSR